MNELETFIPTEVKVIETSYSYLTALGHAPQVSLNMLYLGVELQKANLQARLIAKQAEEGEIVVEQIAARVFQMMKDAGKDSPDDAAPPL